MTEAWFAARRKSFNETKIWKQYFFHKYIIFRFFSKPIQYCSFLTEKEIPQNQLKIVLLEKKILESNLSPNHTHQFAPLKKLFL